MKNVGLMTSLLLGAGLILLFIGRQILGGEGTAADTFAWSGVAAAVGALGWRLAHRAQASDAAKPAETAIFVAYAGVITSLGLYALSTDWGIGVLGLESDGRVAGVLAVFWPALFAVSLAAFLFMELAYSRMPVDEAIELRRIRSAASDGLSIALSLVFVVCVNFAATQEDVRKDLSYFKTTRPSQGTVQMVTSLSEPIKVVAFYPEVNDVIIQLRPYFEELASVGDNFEFEVKDHALAPAIVSKHRVRGNGRIVILKGEGDAQQAEQLEVGLTLEEARSRLRTLDGRFQRSFTKLTTVRRELHITDGHDERSASGAEGDPPEKRTRALTDALGRANLTTRRLGMAQGLANDVPDDVPAVAIIGPRKPFLIEEALSLLRYAQKGGRLVIMIDPDEEHGLEPLLRGLGLSMKEGVLCSDRQFRRRTFTQADRALVFSNRYSSHPTVTLASRNSAAMATIFLHGGGLDRYEGEDATAGINVVFPLRSSSDFWLDQNGDFERNENEAQADVNMMAAVTVPNADGQEGRVVVVADADFVTDLVIRNQGNSLLFSDTLNWLIGQEQIVGDVSSEEDVAIEHTGEEDRVWFWATSFGAPLPLFLLGGFVMSLGRRRRGGRPRGAAAETAGARAKSQSKEGDSSLAEAKDASEAPSTVEEDGAAEEEKGES